MATSEEVRAALLARQFDDTKIVQLKSLRAASLLVDAAIPQAIDLSAVWFPSAVVTPETASALFRST